MNIPILNWVTAVMKIQGNISHIINTSLTFKNAQITAQVHHVRTLHTLDLSMPFERKHGCVPSTLPVDSIWTASEWMFFII